MYNSGLQERSILVDFDAEIIDNTWEWSHGLTSRSRRSIDIRRWIIVVDVVFYVLPPCRYGWIYIRWSTPLTILRLPKPALEFAYVTASGSFASTIDSRVLTPRSINYVIMVMCSYCDTIAIGDTSYGYELIWSQLSTNRVVSPRASESALSYSHQVRNGLTIAANDRTLNLSMLHCSQIYSDLHMSRFAINRTECILRPSGHINPKSYSPNHRQCGQAKGWFV